MPLMLLQPWTWPVNLYKRDNGRYSHCEPEGRGNLAFTWDCFVAPLLAMTQCLCRFY